MSRRVGWSVAAIFCWLCTLSAIPAGDADDPTPTPQDELDSLPISLKVSHDPQPSRATETPNSKRRWRYTWFFKTTVRATNGDVKLTEFGAYSWVNGKWVFNTITGNPFTPKDFADWYACPGA